MEKNTNSNKENIILLNIFKFSAFKYYSKDMHIIVIFEGEFKNGIKWNGKGYNENNEIEYEIKNGTGKIKEYINGRLLYEGEYKNGKKMEKEKNII